MIMKKSENKVVSVQVPALLQFEVYVNTAAMTPNGEPISELTQINAMVEKWLGDTPSPKLVSLTPLGIGLRQVKLHRTGEVQVPND